MKKQLKKIFSLLIIFMTVNLNSQTALLNSDDKLSIPLPLPYDGAIYSEIDVKKFMEATTSKSKQPIIIFGGNWCPDCRILDGSLQVPSIKKCMSEHFEIMHIDVGRYDKNMELMDYFGVAREKGVPRVIVFDKEMNILNSSSTKEWTTARERSLQDIFNYFQKLAL